MVRAGKWLSRKWRNTINCLRSHSDERKCYTAHMRLGDSARLLFFVSHGALKLGQLQRFSHYHSSPNGHFAHSSNKWIEQSLPRLYAFESGGASAYNTHSLQYKVTILPFTKRQFHRFRVPAIVIDGMKCNNSVQFCHVQFAITIWIECFWSHFDGDQTISIKQTGTIFIVGQNGEL